MRNLISLLSLLIALPLCAQSFPETVPQGSLLKLQARPGSTVTVNNLPIPVTSDGTFLVATGRDAKGDLNIVVKNGTEISGKRIPITKTDWNVERIEGLASKYVAPKQEVLERINSDNRKIGKARRITLEQPYFAGGFIKPVPSATRVSGVFGSQRILNGTPKSAHRGVDFAAPAGTPIIAPANGVVTMIVDDMYYTGGTMIIDHGHGLSTVYAHLKSIDVEENDAVQQGQQIGTVGMTGRATGPHLHFGATLRQVHFDPMYLFQ